MKTLSLWMALLGFALTYSAITTKSHSSVLDETCSITAQPTSVPVCSGLNTSFKVTAVGTALTYQWQVDVGFGFWNLNSESLNFSDYDQPELKLNSVTPAMNGYKFRCVVSGTCGTLISEQAVLTVQTPPSINSQPSSIAVCEASSANFQANVSGTSLSFQWQEDKGDGSGFQNLSNTLNYSGANSSNLTINNVAGYLNDYKYRCVVSGVCAGTVTTNAATLTVNPLLTISGQPQNAYTCSSKPEEERTVTFEVQATGSNLTYQWQVDAGFGFVSPPTTPIHTGINSSTLTVSKISSQFNGYIYRCIVTSSCGGTTTSETAVLTVNTNSPSQPSSFSESSSQVNPGQTSVKYTVPVEPGATSYEWTYKDNEGAVIPDVTIYGDGTNSVTVDFGPASTSGIMSVCSANGCGLSAARTMNVAVVPGSVLPVELKSYAAELNGRGSATISWVTASESNNDYFLVEKSVDGKQFSAFKKVGTKGSSSNSYYLVDDEVLPGINYYRLSQTDKNGISTILGIKAVNVSLTAANAQIYPNPLSGNVLKVMFESAEGRLPVLISNLNGQVIFNDILPVKNNQLEIQLTDKPGAGYYLIKVGKDQLSKILLVN